MALRPTISISSWTLAVDLEATRLIQRLSENPAEGCECQGCVNWRTVGSSVLPTALAQEFRRVGCTIEFPADLHVSDTSERQVVYRIVYFAVGKILSGPGATIESRQGGGVFYNYQCIREKPWLALLIMRQRDCHGYCPVFDRRGNSEAIRLDLRLESPFGTDRSNHSSAT